MVILCLTFIASGEFESDFSSYYSFLNVLFTEAVNF
jgi:hypothetical protein